MVRTDCFHEINGCRICQRTELVPVMDLGVQALTGRFPQRDEDDPPKAPLVLVRCVGCGLVQLRHTVDPKEMFGNTYGYRSSINATMRGHLKNIANKLSTRGKLQKGDAVLDIGCNDGTLLMAYTIDGVIRIGIDPAEMFAQNTNNIRVETGYFNASTFLAISRGAKAQAITSLAMFYDLETPGTFVRDISSVLAPDGVWVLEQSYLPSMLENNAFDTICHEHLEYYALAQIDALAQSNGLRVFDVVLNGINGGSLQVWVCHEAASYKPNLEVIKALAAREKALNLTSDAPFSEFRLRVAAIGDRLRSFISAETSSGRKIYAYGASTKGNVLLQHFGLDQSLIKACADKNPIKWNARTPGTGIPIVSEEDARTDADYFLVLPWHFKEEFLMREAEFRAKGGKFIFPLPEFQVI